MNEPKVYRNSPIQFIVILAIFLVIVVSVIATWDGHDSLFQLPILLLVGLVALVQIFAATRKTTVSDTEISTQTLLGTKTINWSDIQRASGRGYAIRLHNYDDNVVVAPNPQLPRYEEIIDSIGERRPDLFIPQDDVPMTRVWFENAAPIGGALLFAAISIGALVANAPSSALVFPFLYFLIFLGILLANNFRTPLSVTISGNSLNLKYLWKETSLLANETQSIDLRSVSTRNGKNLYIVLTSRVGNQTRIAGLKPSLPIVYLILKNWHKKSLGSENPINASWSFDQP